MVGFSDLGNFQLGASALGTSPKQMNIFDTFGIADTMTLSIDMIIEDILGIPDAIAINHAIEIAETLGIIDGGSYLSDYLSGVTGTISVILNITNADFCEMVLEGGHSIEVNGTAGRGILFMKQTGQKFDIGIEIFPGDAVLFTCPDEPIIVVGDNIYHNGYNYEITAIIDHMWANNVVYRKAALKRIRSIPDMPGVYGLIASANEKGSTTLTWLPVTLDWLDHYVIWESVVGDFIVETITAMPTPPSGSADIQVGAYSAGRYTVGGLITIQDSDNGNDGDYEISAYQDVAGTGQVSILTPGKQLLNTGALGDIANISKYYPRDKSKTNKATIKNLVINTPYFYVVRAISKHKDKGNWSNEAETPTDTTVPPTPEDVR